MLPAAPSLATHFYKLAHIHLVQYAVYGPPPQTATTSSDQLLLELELRIRSDHPRSLVTYYNKNLYEFHFVHAELRSLDLGKEYHLEQKCLEKASPEQLLAPLKASGNGANEAGEFLAGAGTALLKAIKKLVLYSLSSSGKLRLFGNYAVASEGAGANHVIHMDPIMFPNGDLLLLAFNRDVLVLYDTDILKVDRDSLAAGTATESLANFAIYLIPSGIRCHLYDTINVWESFTYIPPRNSENLVHLLGLCTGTNIECTENTLWVKLIPNLQHLNNQTSKIARFIHLVDNRKYILWPWSFCVLQFGHTEMITEGNSALELVDPLSLISDFMDFSITSSLQQPSSTQPPFSVPSVESTGASTGPTNGHEITRTDPLEMGDIPSLDVNLFEATGDLQNDFFLNQNEIKLSAEEPLGEVAEKSEDAEMDDLFGDFSDEEKDTVNEPSEAPQNGDMKIENGPTETIEALYTDDMALDPEHPKTEEVEPSSMPSQEEIPPKSTGSRPKRPETATYIDIPKDQMTVPALRKYGSPPSSYNDPGAPLPIVPTPLIPQSAGYPSNSTMGAVPSSTPAIEVDQNESRLVFSPLLFNPIIRSNIDTKYGKGGKFYVDKEQLLGPDDGTKKTRATSVTGFAYPYGSQKYDSESAQDDPVKKARLGLGLTDADYTYESEVVFDDTSVKSDADSQEDEESDEDEELLGPEMAPKSPLRLNVLDPYVSGDVSRGTGMLSLPAGPGMTAKLGLVARFDSPLGLPALVQETSQMVSPSLVPKEDSNEESDKKENDSMAGTPGSGTGSRAITESSNCLPLILRGINVSSIPSVYLLNNVSGVVPFTAAPADFNTDDDDFDTSRNGQLAVKTAHLETLLRWLSPALVFDLGWEAGASLMPKVPFLEDEDAENPPLLLEKMLSEAFPRSYRVLLGELTAETTPSEASKDDMDGQLNFLDDIINDDLLNPASQRKRLQALAWDALCVPDNAADDDYTLYRRILESIQASYGAEETVFTLNSPKARVFKHEEAVNIDSVGLRFWQYLNFRPVAGPKHFQMVVALEPSPGTLLADHNRPFVDALVASYRENNLGSISPLALEDDPEGLLLVDRPSAAPDAYTQIGKRLGALVDMIKRDLLSKTGGFEFGRPLLLLFVSFDDALNAPIQIAQVCRRFRAALDAHQLPLVEFFAHVVPWKQVFKQHGDQRLLRYLSSHRLCQLATSLYNRCPSGREQPSCLYTQLVKEPPTHIPFKFSSFKENADGADDIFLHMAYERLVDKAWVAAAWLDPAGVVTHTRAWYAGFGAKSDIGSICDDMWEASSELFKHLTSDTVKKTAGIGGRKYLVLTRVSSVIPDDELVHWKRLSVKHKDVSLVVLLVNRAPTTLFDGDAPPPTDPPSALDPAMVAPTIASTGTPSAPGSAPDFFKGFANFDPSTVLSPAGANSTSPSTNGLAFHSPQQFLNVPGSFLSPQDFMASAAQGSSGGGSEKSRDPDMVLYDRAAELYGVVPRTPLPSFNSPTRMGMKVGYLLKKGPTLGQQCQYWAYEVTLLSCLNQWQLDTVMRLLLGHYKKLVVLADVLGVGVPKTVQKETEMDENGQAPPQNGPTGMVPWHVRAVGKTLDYLVHIAVEE